MVFNSDQYSGTGTSSEPVYTSGYLSATEDATGNSTIKVFPCRKEFSDNTVKLLIKPPRINDNLREMIDRKNRKALLSLHEKRK